MISVKLLSLWDYEGNLIYFCLFFIEKITCRILQLFVSTSDFDLFQMCIFCTVILK